MDIRTALENFALAQTPAWRFRHARRDYANIHDVLAFVGDQVESFADNETAIFLDPVTTSKEADGIRYTGNFMILTKSDLDMDYETKYATYVKPALDIAHGTLWNKLRCDFDFTTWSVVEVINVFDFNADGVNVQFNVKGY